MIDHTNDKMKQSTELGTLILGPAPRNSKKKACNSEKTWRNWRNSLHPQEIYGGKQKNLQLTEASFDKIGKNGDRKVNVFFTMFKTITRKFSIPPYDTNAKGMGSSKTKRRKITLLLSNECKNRHVTQT